MEQILKRLVLEIISQLTTPNGITTITTALGTIYATNSLIQTIKNHSTKAKLIKKNKIENCKPVDKAPEITQISKNKSNIEENPEIKEIISNFINTLNQSLTHNQMETVKKNIETLYYKEANIIEKIRLNINGIGGYYQGEQHSITPGFYLDKEQLLHVLYHELIHASTSSNTKENNYCGFAQRNKITKKELGRAINEGYTELLTRRYFENNCKRGYSYEVAVAEMIEFIIGKEIMKELFFNLDLNGLINELGKYTDLNRAKQFISDLDTTSKLIQPIQSDGQKQALSYFYNQISIFLYDAFSNKINQYLNTNNTNKYFEESNKFQQLFSEITKNQNNKISIKSQLEYAKKILQNINQINKPKKLAKSKIPNTTNNTKGFINIITIIALLTIITTLSIGISYLLLQAR